MGELYRLDFSSGKSYIGISTISAAHRFRGHRQRHNELKTGRTALYNAWRKHGEPQLVLLAIVEDKDLAETEVRAIKTFRTMAPNGYNATPGGDTPPFMVPEIAEKILAATRGNKFALGSKHERSPAYRCKLSKALAGNKNAVGNKHGIGNRNAAGKRNAQAIANIKAGVAKALAAGTHPAGKNKKVLP